MHTAALGWEKVEKLLMLLPPPYIVHTLWIRGNSKARKDYAHLKMRRRVEILVFLL